jgi:hypothetical protein
LFIGLVNKLLCSQAQIKTTTAAPQEPVESVEAVESADAVVANPKNSARATFLIFLDL